MTICGIFCYFADLQRQLTEEATARGDMDANLYGEAIPEAGPVNTIKKNADAIATLNGADTVDGSVAQKIKALKEELDAEVEYKDANSLVKVADVPEDRVVAKVENGEVILEDTPEVKQAKEKLKKLNEEISKIKLELLENMEG